MDFISIFATQHERKSQSISGAILNWSIVLLSWGILQKRALHLSASGFVKTPAYSFSSSIFDVFQCDVCILFLFFFNLSTPARQKFYFSRAFCLGEFNLLACLNTCWHSWTIYFLWTDSQLNIFSVASSDSNIVFQSPAAKPGWNATLFALSEDIRLHHRFRE